MRTALGAGRGRLMRQLLTESVVLALVGGALGLLVAAWTQQLLIASRPRTCRGSPTSRSTGASRSFAFAATIVVGMLFGLTPALQSSRPELNADLKDGGRTGTSRTGMRNVMVVAQVALALVLLIGAGLMLTSFSRLRAVDPGFRTTELVTVELMLPLARYDEPAQRTLLHERARAAAGQSGHRAIRPCCSRFRSAAATRKRASRDHRPARETARAATSSAELYSISPGYLQTRRASG